MSNVLIFSFESLAQGYSCEDSTAPGDDFNPGMSSDPWSDSTYTSDANGAASVSLTVPRFATTEGIATAYHALVVSRSLLPFFLVLVRVIIFRALFSMTHDALFVRVSSTDDIGCGLIGAPYTAVASLTAYPVCLL